MRNVTYGGAISLDGYLAGPDEAIDWLRWTDDSARISADTFRGVDTMLMGRKTFEFAQAMGGGPKTPGIATYVFSRTLDRLPAGVAAELVSDDVAEFVRRLKGEPGGGILVMGGGEIGTALLEARLVDEIGFAVHPILLGDGIPAFREISHRVELTLQETRAIKGDCVLLRYLVVG